jgi:hypothetical protein
MRIFRNPTVEEKNALSASFNNMPAKRDYFTGVLNEVKVMKTAQEAAQSLRGSGISFCIKTATPNKLEYWIINTDIRGVFNY